MKKHVQNVLRHTANFTVCLVLAFGFFSGHLNAFGPAHDPVAERNTVLAVFPTASATNSAIASGNWSSASTWSNGVPASGQRVHIPSGYTVTYDVNTDANLNWVRIDGTLNFTASANTRLVTETLLVAPTGALSVGNSTVSLPSARTARITFRPNGDINTTNDPKMFSRGLLNFGTVNLYGTPKTAFVATQTDAQFSANQTTITLSANVPSDWAVGDEILLPGTSFNKDEANYSRDDIRTISAKSGSVITLNSGLTYSRSYPTGYGFKLHVANLTRNIILETENWSTHTPIRRAHTMHFNGCTVNLRYVAHIGLGRTDKSKTITDPGVGINDGYSPAWDSYENPRGRYALHIHQLGAASISATPVTLKGNVIRNSPGWGIAIHKSVAVIEDNVTYNIHGAHIVTEDETELVWIRNNMSVGALGNDAADNMMLLEGIGNIARDRRRDTGERGIGYWLDSPYSVREFTGNVMAGMRDAGVIFYGHDDTEDNYGDMHGEQLVPLTNIDANLHYLFKTVNTATTETMNYRVPLGNVANNIAYNCNGGMDLRGQLRDDTGFDDSVKSTFHDYVETIKTFTAFNVNYGAHGAYAARVRLEDCVFIGNPSNPIRRPTGQFSDRNGPYASGINWSGGVRAMEVKNCRVEGFEWGVELTHTRGLGVHAEDEAPWAPFVLEGGTFANNVHHLGASTGRFFDSIELGETGEEVLTPPYTEYAVIKGSPSFTAPQNDPLPVASFAYAAKPGLSLEFDASDSYDSNYPLGLYDPVNSPWGNAANGDWAAYGADNTIPFFVWDVGNDGTIDGYGRKFLYNFSSTGTKTVKLTVYDSNGQTTSVVRNDISVANTPATELIADGNFSGTPKFINNFGSVESEFFVHAWRKTNASRWEHDANNGWLYSDTTGAGLIAQTIWDRKLTRGNQTLKFDYINNSGKSFRIRVWGASNPYLSLKTYKATDVLLNTSNSSPASITLLYTKTVSTAQSSWTAFTDTVSFGNAGYEYIIVDLWTTGAASGTLMAIDNISLANNGPIPPTAPTEPAMASAGSVSSSQIDFSFTDASTNEQGFNLAYKASASSTWTDLTNENAATGTGTVITIGVTGLTSSTSYDFRARAFNSAGSSAWTMANATTAAAAPAAPTSPAATGVSSTQMTFSCVDASTDETGFDAEYKLSSDSTWIALSDPAAISGTGTTVSVNITGLTANTSYDFRARAYNSAGTSDWVGVTASTSLGVTTFPFTIEAENAVNVAQSNFAPYSIYSNNTSARPAASPAYINWLTANVNETNTTTGDSVNGQAHYEFTLGSSAATVDIWARCLFATAADNSVFTKLTPTDGATWTNTSPAANTAWTWRKLRTYTNLAPGTYTFKLLIRETGSAVDQIYITINGSTPQ